MKEARTKEPSLTNQLQADVNEFQKKKKSRTDNDFSAKSTITTIRRENNEVWKNIDYKHSNQNISKLNNPEQDITRINLHMLKIIPKQQISVSNLEQNTFAKDDKYNVQPY